MKEIYLHPLANVSLNGYWMIQNTDKFGNEVTEPLIDLEGNIVTRAGWYDFTHKSKITSRS